MTKSTVPQVDIPGLAEYLAGQADVVLAYLFGSVARGDAGPGSDVDIAVLFDSGLDARALVERQLDLMVALDRFADREVQVTVLNRAAPRLAHEVVLEGRVLCERDPDARVDFEVRVMRTYLDLAPMMQFFDRILMERIREVGLGRPGGGRHPGTLEAAERLRGRLTRTAGG